jgi:hypothetical protein
MTTCRYCDKQATASTTVQWGTVHTCEDHSGIHGTMNGRRNKVYSYNSRNDAALQESMMYPHRHPIWTPERS